LAQQLPSALINALQTVKGFNEAAFKQVHQLGGQVTSVRCNPKKIFNVQYFPDSNRDNIKLEKVKWNDEGYYLSQRPSFTLDPLFHAGAYYVQEASSMFLQQALQQTVDLLQPLKILDLCAAPGGKSTLIQSLINEASLLVSNEVIKPRVNVLSENITKWGAANIIVTNNDPKDFKRLENYFDVIVVDAPCSGSGLFRKDAAAIGEWSMNNVQLCSQRQQRILAAIMPALKQDGVLIYCTCSYSAAEDEEICDWMMGQFAVGSLQLAVDKSWGIVETVSDKHNAYGYRFYPDKVKGEGFFIAAFINKQRPPIAIGGGNRQIEKRKIEKLLAKEMAVIKPYLKNADDFLFIKQNNEVIALPIYLQDDLSAIQLSLYIKKAGVKMGTIIRDELMPHHELALSTIINIALPAITVDLATALQYLRKQEIKIEAAIKGWALIKYQQLPLGWVKILPNRVNNYYPKEWRIINK
jgi:16S rRNA C967 or C1407 C5-methylase (RsmB/RsmF family)/NOL1/NOP2/fmu family ribosome biogenesis protein